MPVRSQRPLGALDQAVEDRGLVGGCEVGGAGTGLVLAELPQLVQQRGLQPGEGEVETLGKGLPMSSAPAARALGARAWKDEGLGVAVAREALEGGAAGVAEPEHARALVEGLAGGVVERAPEHVEAVVGRDVDEQRVPAACDQAEEGRLEWGLAGAGGRIAATAQEIGGDVTLQVIDRRERQLARGGESLCGGQPDEQRADETGALRGGDQLELIEPDGGLLQRALHDRVDDLEVMARGDLGHDAAEVLVCGLRGDHVGADTPVGVDHGGAGVVAAGLEREDHAGGLLIAGRSSHGPGVGHVLQRAEASGGRAPHHERVLAVVLVVATADAGGAEALALVEVDGDGV